MLGYTIYYITKIPIIILQYYIGIQIPKYKTPISLIRRLPPWNRYVWATGVAWHVLRPGRRSSGEWDVSWDILISIEFMAYGD